jgi:hypothetical protein
MRCLPVLVLATMWMVPSFGITNNFPTGQVLSEANELEQLPKQESQFPSQQEYDYYDPSALENPQRQNPDTSMSLPPQGVPVALHPDSFPDQGVPTLAQQTPPTLAQQTPPTLAQQTPPTLAQQTPPVANAGAPEEDEFMNKGSKGKQSDEFDDEDEGEYDDEDEGEYDDEDEGKYDDEDEGKYDDEDEGEYDDEEQGPTKAVKEAEPRRETVEDREPDQLTVNFHNWGGRGGGGMAGVPLPARDSQRSASPEPSAPPQRWIDEDFDTPQHAATAEREGEADEDPSETPRRQDPGENVEPSEDDEEDPDEQFVGADEEEDDEQEGDEDEQEDDEDEKEDDEEEDDEEEDDEEEDEPDSQLDMSTIDEEDGQHDESAMEEDEQEEDEAEDEEDGPDSQLDKSAVDEEDDGDRQDVGVGATKDTGNVQTLRLDDSPGRSQKDLEMQSHAMEMQGVLGNNPEGSSRHSLRGSES